jgi:2'-5' RNA ligase
LNQASEAFDVAIYPDVRIRRQAIAASRSLAKLGSLYTLDERGPFPHISLYLTQFPIANLVKIESLLRNFAKSATPFTVRAAGYQQSEKAYVAVAYDKSHDIQKLHMGTLQLLNPLREGLIRDKDRERLKLWSDARRESVEKYGYHSAGSEYKPHISLAKMAQPEKLHLAELEDFDFTFEVNKIGLFRAGNYGTCIEAVALFDLAG